MTRLCAATRLMVLSLGLVPIAAAPDQVDGEGERDSTCVEVERDGRSTRVVVNTEIPIEIEVPTQITTQCDATIALEYTQRDAIVRVEGRIDNGTCAASSGDYAIVVSFRDGNGEVKTLEFGETWQRSDDRPIAFTTDYRIGENVDLVGVRSRRLRCVCAGPPGE